ncbi:hypothetical protein D3C72_1082080 [compost metagenome]
MFVERARVVARGLDAGNHQRGARHQPAHHRHQQRVAGQLGQCGVELGGEPDPARARVRQEGLALGLHHLAQRGDHGADVGQAGELLQHGALEHLAQLEHVVRFVGGRAGDERAPVGFEVDHAVSGQPREHLAHGVARGGIDLAKRMLGQLGARRQPVLHDRVVDLVVHALLHGALAGGLVIGGGGLGFGHGGNQFEILGHPGHSQGRQRG